MEQDTIVAISSAPGAGLRGIVRVSGSMAFPIVSQFWQEKLLPQTYQRIYGPLNIKAWHTQVDSSLYLMKAPYSYTREDLIEIHILSSPILLETIQKQIIEAGARPAAAGEFTRRAFLAGRIDLSQVEAIASLISATSEAERRMAIAGVCGAISQKISAIQSSLKYVIALVEAHIDFSDEEIAPLEISEVTSRLEPIVKDLKSLGSTQREIGDSAIVVCLCGAPNAGKSTLFNALLEENCALTSKISGTTLDWLEGQIVLKGIDFKLIDTPGLEESPKGIQQRAQQQVPDLLKGSDLILHLLDSSDSQNSKIEQMPDVPILHLHTKSDLGKPRRTVSGEKLEVSSVSGAGIDELKQWLWEQGIKIAQNKTPSLLNARQFHVAAKAAKLVEEALKEMVSGISYEFIAGDLRCALDYLGEIVGKITTEDILDDVFSEFCIGK